GGSGDSKLDMALRSFAQDEPPGGFTDRAYSLLVKTILSIGCHAFGTNIDAMKRYLSEPTVRRGVTAVLSSIGSYGITRPQLLKAPFLVVWNFTNACNLRCKHCYQNAGKRLLDELSKEEKLRVVRELADAGVVAVAFSGGEPLSSPEFFEIAKAARDHDLYVALATNGTLISKDTARRLREIDVCYVEVSLDAASPQLHDSFRGIQGSHERSLQGIRNCVDEGIFTCIATTVTRNNVKEVRGLIELARRMKVNRFIHFNFIPAGRGREIVELDISPVEREELLRTLYEESKVPGIEVLSTAPQFGRMVTEKSMGRSVAPTHFYIGNGGSWGLQSLAQFIGGCGAGRLYCAIQPNGLVTPCVFMPDLTVGDLRITRFRTIWRENEILRQLRNKDLLKPGCGACVYRHVCGGCRARSLVYLEDHLAPDVGCIRNLSEWERLKTVLAHAA
ncbi:radical SAM protein, partial [Candidatus Bathyarchaeota archaeon]|nr:radical SAM protein [Candidatus Bathyarchaeota archaeon]